ncbi:MAG: family peptidase [Herminiimonas sp.]|nr:family peptidase [Herminiimonas sp.]
MKFVIARLNHETNTFSPVPTPLAAFGPCFGPAALRDQQGARTAMGAYIALAQSIPGVEIVTPLAAMANPSGTVDAAAYDTMCESILSAIEAGCDAILLDLHGAMVAANAPDGEGTLLERIRRVAPMTPICVALDLHANLTRKMVENCDLIVSFKTYPHIDMFETGSHAGRLLWQMMQSGRQVAMRWRQLPLLSHTLRSNTTEGAMQRAVQAAEAAEREPGVQAVSVLAGFSLADFPDAGMSVVVVADEPAQADAVAQRIAAQIWRERDGFVYDSEPLRDSLERARRLAASPAGEEGSGPVLLLDHSDNVMSGGTCDTMDVLVGALEAGLEDIAMGPLADPAAVAQLIHAGVGATVTVDLGNKVALRQTGSPRRPVRLTGVVRAIATGELKVTGPIYTGSILKMGRTVLFDIGAAQIVVTEERVEPYDLGVLSCVGIDPGKKRFLLLKSRMYCRPVFMPLSRGLVECDADQGGPTSSNYKLFEFRHLRRPVYPLDSVLNMSSLPQS